MNLDGVPPQTLEHLLALTQRLTMRRDLEELLHDLLDGSLALIEGSDFVCVFLYQPEHNALVPVGGLGFDMRYLKDVWIKPGESMTGKAYLTRSPLLLPNAHAIRKAQDNLSPQHDAQVRLAVGRPDNPVRSSMAIPLIAEQRTLGVMVIDNYDTDRDFTQVDLAVASSLADHAALAVINADDYRQVRTLSDELQRTLRLQKRLVASMMSPHSSMTTLLKTLWAMLERPLCVLDENHQVLAHYGGDLGPAHHIPIQIGNHQLGELVIGMEDGSPLEHPAIEQAIPLIALEFMKQEAREQERLSSASHAFQHIWNGEPEGLEQVIRKYQLDEVSWQFVLIPHPSHTTIEDLVAFSRAHDIPIMNSGRQSILLLQGNHLDDLHDPLLRIAGFPIFWSERNDSSRKLTPQLRALVMLAQGSAYYFSRSELKSREISLQDYPEMSLIESLRQDVRGSYADQVLGILKEDKSLFDSVVAYLTSNRSVNEAAALLHTHPNTLRYRLEKASHSLGRPLSDDRTILALRWALLSSVNLSL